VTNGNLVAGPLTNSATGVANGLFTATLDFGPGVFTGPARWLELDVRTNGSGAFTLLLPRQPLLPMPYAIMANTASNLLGTLPAAQLSGTVPANQLSGTVPLAQLPASVCRFSPDEQRQRSESERHVQRQREWQRCRIDGCSRHFHLAERDRYQPASAIQHRLPSH
jgi:hypothetical protein